MPFLRSTAAFAALILAPLAACAQGFNSAPPNASGQTPAFEGQTRAPALPDDIALETTVIADGLEHPWGMAQLVSIPVAMAVESVLADAFPPGVHAAPDDPGLVDRWLAEVGGIADHMAKVDHLKA